MRYISIGKIEQVDMATLTAIVRDLDKGGTIVCRIPVTAFNDLAGNRTEIDIVRVGTKCCYVFVDGVSPAGFITSFYDDEPMRYASRSNANKSEDTSREDYKKITTFDSSSQETRSMDGSYNFKFESGFIFFDRMKQFLNFSIKVLSSKIGGLIVNLKEGILYLENSFSYDSGKNVFRHTLASGDSGESLVEENYDDGIIRVLSKGIKKGKKIFYEMGMGVSINIKGKDTEINITEKTKEFLFNGNSITTDKDSMTIEFGNNKITLDKNMAGMRVNNTGVFISKKGKVTLQCDSDLEVISAKNITFKAEKNITMEAGGNINIASQKKALLYGVKGVTVFGNKTFVADSKIKLSPSDINTGINEVRSFASKIMPVSPVGPCSPDPVASISAATSNETSKITHMSLEATDAQYDRVITEKIK